MWEYLLFITSNLGCQRAYQLRQDRLLPGGGTMDDSARRPKIVLVACYQQPLNNIILSMKLFQHLIQGNVLQKVPTEPSNINMTPNSHHK